jgi:hypothetical protein
MTPTVVRLVHSSNHDPDPGYTPELSVEEFVDLMLPEIERQVDELIESQADPVDREILRRHRARLVHESVQATRIANYKHRLACAEARLRPALAHPH